MPTLPDLPQTEVAIVEMTNSFRRERKLAALKPNAALTAAARAFAAYLARTGRFSHEADGRAPHERAEAHGYRYCLVAENLASHLDSRGFQSQALARKAVEGWKASPGHRANMLTQGATEIGVGVVGAPGGIPKFLSVQLIARPESFKVEFSIENRSGAAVRYRLGGDWETLPARTVATHASCDANELAVDRVQKGTARISPRNGDRFVVRSDASGALLVERTRE